TTNREHLYLVTARPHNMPPLAIGSGTAMHTNRRPVAYCLYSLFLTPVPNDPPWQSNDHRSHPPHPIPFHHYTRACLGEGALGWKTWGPGEARADTGGTRRRLYHVLWLCVRPAPVLRQGWTSSMLSG